MLLSLLSNINEWICACVLIDRARIPRRYNFGAVILRSRKKDESEKFHNIADINSACIKQSYLWQQFKKYQLKTNIRVYEDGDEYSRFLLSVVEDRPEKTK